METPAAKVADGIGVAVSDFSRDLARELLLWPHQPVHGLVDVPDRSGE
jgi:hypothetical protein